MGAHNLLAWFFCLGVVLMCTSTRADNEGPTPPLGEYCPPQTYFDSVNCLFGTAPAQTEAFIYAEKFYHTPRPGGQLCGPLTTFEAPNCIFRHVPAGYEPFIYQNGWYVKPNARFLRVVADCPGGTSYDGTGCLYGAPPAGRHASIIQQHTSWVFGFSQYFAFNRNFGESCGSVLAGSMEGGSGPWSGLGTHLCVFGRVPSTWDGFVRDDRWYISPRLAFNAGPWRVKTLPAEWPLDSQPVCRADEVRLPSGFEWKLVWADEFDTVPDNTACYTSDDQALCRTHFYWYSSFCAGQPSSYTDFSRANSWSPGQTAAFAGLRNLNKCTWEVLDSYNLADVTENSPPVQNSYRPENMRVEDGVLKMVTRFHGPQGSGYDCGTALDASVNDYTKTCPFSGAMIQTSVSNRVTQEHSPDNPDPLKRYMGRPVDFTANVRGRLEFRAMIKQIGHGAWPSLWLMAEEGDPATGLGEIDVLEYLGFDQANPRQILDQSVTFGNALQTIHNHNAVFEGSHGVGIPISVGEWHTYRVEFENKEVRFYIDNCLRSRIKEGQIVKKRDGTMTQFRVPQNQQYIIIISNPASAASWLPDWYRAEMDNAGVKGAVGSNFRPTELHVDYVRYYVAQEVPVLVSSSGGWAHARTHAPSGGLQRLLSRPASPKSHRVR